jgi:hypothetical protein
MQITIEIPDSAAADLTASGQDPARALLEGFALERIPNGPVVGISGPATARFWIF